MPQQHAWVGLHRLATLRLRSTPNNEAYCERVPVDLLRRWHLRTTPSTWCGLQLAAETIFEIVKANDNNNDQYEIIWCNGLQLPDTLVPEREDVQCEDDDSAVVLSSNDEHGELSSENDDDDAGDDHWMNRANHYRSCHLGLAGYSVSTIIVMHSNKLHKLTDTVIYIANLTGIVGYFHYYVSFWR